MNLNELDHETRAKIIAHIENALAYDDETRKRKVKFPVDSTRPTSARLDNTYCTMCTVRIRPGTNIISGMHPRCARVFLDPREALNMPVNGIAARVLLDRLYVDVKRDDASLASDKAREIAHRELLARFDASESESESENASDKSA